MKVLVTGAAGFIGSHLTEALIQRGHDVVGVDCFDEFLYPAEFKRRNLSEVEKATGASPKRIRENILSPKIKDILDEGSFDIIVHLAARAGVRASLKDPLSYSDYNIKGTINLLEAAVHSGVKHFVFGSSSSVYGATRQIPFSENDPVDKPLSVYAASKRSGELVCHAYHRIYGLSVNCLRFFTVYGPRQRPDMAIHKFTQAIDRGMPITIYGDGTSKRDYTYVTDIVQGILGAMKYRNRFDVFNLGNSRTVELKYLIFLLERELGKNANVKYEEWPETDPLVTCADISKARRLLGYDPQISIEEGVHNFVKWYKDVRRV